MVHTSTRNNNLTLGEGKVKAIKKDAVFMARKQIRIIFSHSSFRIFSTGYLDGRIGI